MGVVTYNVNENHSCLCCTEPIMSFLFFFASLVSAAVAAEAVRRRRNVREATKVGAVFFCGSECGRFGVDGNGCGRRVCGGGLCAFRGNFVGSRAPRAGGGRVVDGIVIRGAGGSGSDFCLGGIGGGAPAKQRGTVAAAACRALEAVGSGAGASLESAACRDARLSNIGQWKCCTIGCTVDRKL